MEYPADCRYTEDHEWVRPDGDLAVVGITPFAAGELGDVVFVELPEVGASVTKGDSFGVVESVKTASDLYAPVSGQVVEVNAPLEDAPQQVNEEPMGSGWMIKVKMSDPAELDALLDAAAYAAHVGS